MTLWSATMVAVISYLDFIGQFGGMEYDDFLIAVHHPYLLVLEREELDEHAFRTVKFTPELLKRARGKVVNVLRVNKRPGANSFSMITVGRSNNNDVILHSPEISKFHAYLKDIGDGEWVVVDANSHNGTFVNSSRVRPEVETRLQSGTRIGVGNTQMIFYLPIELYDRIQTDKLTYT